MSTLSAPTCVTIPDPPTRLELTLPGGLVLKGIPSIEGGVTTEIGAVQSLLSQAAPALAAMQPPLLTIDAVLALFNLFGAIPDLIGGDVQGYIQAVEDAFEKVSKLATLIPQVSVPRMIGDTITMLISAMVAVDTLVTGLVAQKADAQAALNTAQATGNAYLEAHANCVLTQVDQYTKHVGAALGPVGDIMGVADRLMSMVPGMPSLPSISDASAVPLDDMHEAIEAAIGVLRAVQIPGVS